MNRTVATLVLAASVVSALAACDPNGGSSATTTSTATATPTSTIVDEATLIAQHQTEIEHDLTAAGFKVVPGSVQLIGNAAMYLIANFRLDLGCTIADGVGFSVDTRESPYKVTAEVRTTSDGADGSSQDTDKKYTLTAQPTPKQIEADGFCAKK